MSSRSKVNAWSYQNVVADGDAVAVDKCTVEINANVRADVDVGAEATREVVADTDIRAYGSKQFFEHLPSLASS